jgi:hypothetical protein
VAAHEVVEARAVYELTVEARPACTLHVIEAEIEPEDVAGCACDAVFR